ncbi:MAG: carboxyltransferase domain-containing protein [Alphaproteobacteria bacterium]|nr:MAG: carboxyltransferase domain-containing protein [Alphaproteobacteria bacterium]
MSQVSASAGVVSPTPRAKAAASLFIVFSPFRWLACPAINSDLWLHIVDKLSLFRKLSQEIFPAPEETGILNTPPRPRQAELLPLGPDAVIVRFALAAGAQVSGAVQAFSEAARQAAIQGVREVTASLNSVLVRFERRMTSREAIMAALDELLGAEDWLNAPLPEPRRRWRVPALFGGRHGPQLAEAAGLAGVSEARAVREIAGAELRVLAIGFAPGQPYLGLLPENWDFPRQSHLTPEVPAGAVTVAVRQIVLFANASKTGWRQVGLSAFRPFWPERAEPFLLRQGDALRFEPVSENEMDALLANASDGLGGARCEVLG